MADYPAFIRVYDVLSLDGEDLRTLGFEERRKRLAEFLTKHPFAPIDLSPLMPFKSWDELTAARADPASVGARSGGR